MTDQTNKEKVYIDDYTQPTYLDGVECQYAVMRGDGQKPYNDETVAYVFEKKDAEFFAAALSASAPAAGSGPSDAEIMAIAKKMVPAFAEWPASCVDFARALLAQYGSAARSEGVPEGWKLNTADFSLQANGRSDVGSVMLVRDVAGRARWHAQTDEQQQVTTMHARGSGKTFPEALERAALAARTSPPLAAPSAPQEGK